MISAKECGTHPAELASLALHLAPSSILTVTIPTSTSNMSLAQSSTPQTESSKLKRDIRYANSTYFCFLNIALMNVPSRISVKGLPCFCCWTTTSTNENISIQRFKSCFQRNHFISDQKYHSPQVIWRIASHTLGAQRVSWIGYWIHHCKSQNFFRPT